MDGASPYWFRCCPPIVQAVTAGQSYSERKCPQPHMWSSADLCCITNKPAFPCSVSTAVSVPARVRPQAAYWTEGQLWGQAKQHGHFILGDGELWDSSCLLLMAGLYMHVYSKCTLYYECDYACSCYQSPILWKPSKLEVLKDSTLTLEEVGS